LLAYGQRLCLESSERVIAAIRSRIHCEYHALTTVAGRSVGSLAAMNPDRVCIFNNEFPSGKVVVIGTQCNRDEASVDSAPKRSAWCIKAGLGHRVVLGMERERDGVSRCGADVGRIIDEACSIVADIDAMGHRSGRGVPGGGGRE